jgi:drug/metabolite transporter (DMT)-like permease
VAFFLSGGVGIRLGDLAILAVLGVFQLGIAFCLFLSGSRHLPPAESSLITLLETVVGPVLVWLAIGESPTVSALVGGVAVVGALIVHSILLPRKAKVP